MFSSRETLYNSVNPPHQSSNHQLKVVAFHKNELHESGPEIQGDASFPIIFHGRLSLNDFCKEELFLKIDLPRRPFLRKSQQLSFSLATDSFLAILNVFISLSRFGITFIVLLPNTFYEFPLLA